MTQQVSGGMVQGQSGVSTGPINRRLVEDLTANVNFLISYILLLR